MFLYRGFELDSRVEREARTLAGAGCRVEVIARLEHGLARTEERDGYTIRRVSPRDARTRLAARLRDASLPGWARELGRRAYWFWHWRNFLRRAYRDAVAHPGALLVAHDLDALGAGVRARRRLGVALIYDAHELFPDMRARPEPERRLWMRYEARLLRRVDLVFAVTASRAEEMRRRYRIETPRVLRNVPEVAPEGSGPDVRERLGIEPGTAIVLYLGGLQPNRGLEQLIRALADLPGCVLGLMGSGEEPYVASLRELAAAVSVGGRLHLTDPVRPHQVVAAAATADVGVILNLNTGLNNYLSLPNKIFEYLGAGVPVVASDFPDMAELIARYDVGATCDPEDPGAIAAAIRAVIGDPARHRELRAHAAEAARELNWERESAVLLSAVDALLPR